MPRYTTRRPRAWIEDDWASHEDPFLPSIEDDGPAEVNTGLLSATGEPIYRISDPIGFGRDSER